MSRAVVVCSGSGRPEAFLKVVLVMPMSCALRVIKRAKFCSVPAMCWASAMATSLADLVTSAFMASSTVISAPGLTSSLEGAASAPSCVILIFEE